MAFAETKKYAHALLKKKDRSRGVPDSKFHGYNKSTSRQNERPWYLKGVRIHRLE